MSSSGENKAIIEQGTCPSQTYKSREMKQIRRETSMQDSNNMGVECVTLGIFKESISVQIHKKKWRRRRFGDSKEEVERGDLLFRCR